MEFLKKYKISDKCIDEIVDRYSESVLYNFIVQEKNVSIILSYFQEIGIQDLNRPLLENFDLFFKDPRQVVAVFETNKSLVEALNKDSITWAEVFD